MTLKRRFSLWMLFLMVCFTSLVGISTYLSPHAHAAQNPKPTCAGADCDGKGPWGTNCYVDQNIVYAETFYGDAGLLGTLQILHSTACQTEWAQVFLVPNVYVHDITILRCTVKKHGQYTCSGGAINEGFTTTKNAIVAEAHTVMVYEPYMSARAMVYVERETFVSTGFY